MNDNRTAINLFFYAAFALAGYLLLTFVPLVQGYTVPAADGLCSSGIGRIDQALSATASSVCGHVSTWNEIRLVLFVATLILAMAGVLVLVFSRDRVSELLRQHAEAELRR